MNLLNEVFDEDKLDLPVTNLYPKTKIPQIFAVGAIEDNGTTPAFRMCSYTSGGDTNKNVKPGDKMIHVVMMSLSEKGTLVKLKNLGPDPVAVMSTTFNIVYDAVKTYKMDAVLFRMNKTKVGGQARQLQVIMDRLVRTRTGGKFVILKELWDYDKKYSYILIHRKSVDLQTIPGVPEISTEMFTKVDSDVGEVFVNKESGRTVSKAEALAATIAQVNDKRTDQNVIARAKISRRAVAASQSIEAERFEGPDFQKYENSAAQFSKPVTAELVKQATELDVAMNSLSSKLHIKNWVTRYASDYALMYTGNHDVPDNHPWVEDLNDAFSEKISKVFEKNPLTSVKSMEAILQAALEGMDDFKGQYIRKMEKEYEGFPEASGQALMRWNKARSEMAKRLLQEYAKKVSELTYGIVYARGVPEQYSTAERQGIKEYCGSGYSDMNNMLLGRYDEDSYDTLNPDEVNKSIKNLDSAFLKGDRLPAGITLYRAQTIRSPIFEALVKNKVFYFRNYVSTSLYPIIFGGWKGNAAVGLASDEQRSEINIDDSPEKVTIPLGTPDTNPNGTPYVPNIKVSVGWAIDGAEKINVIFPGDLSNMTSEQEIILPRGTMVQINRISDASYNDGIAYNNQRFIQAEVMTSEQLDESTVVYDGDILMETGELVEKDKYDFSLFVESTKSTSSNEAMGMLASCMDLTDLPRRFID